MTKQEAEQLIKLVASPSWIGFVDYKLSKLEALHKELEVEGSMDRVRKLQGEISQIREDLELKDKILYIMNTM